jgi:hypothetical protein
MAKNSEIKAENTEVDVGNFTSKFSVTGMIWFAASVICGGIFRYFLPQCTVHYG